MKASYLLGLGTAEQNTADVKKTNVGPGFFDSWLDTALVPVGIPAADAPRVPAAVRSIMEGTGAKVDQARWGNTGEGTAGRLYVRWKPEHTWNAVDYANIAYRIFRAAELQFPQGAHLVMQRYRFTPYGIGVVTPITTLAYAYPDGPPPSSPLVPAAARRTLPEEVLNATLLASLPPPTPSTEQDASGGATDLFKQPQTWVVVGGVVFGAGLIYRVVRGRMGRNRRSR